MIIPNDDIKHLKIETGKKIIEPHHFIIKYKTQEVRNYFTYIVTKLINEFELKNFHVEEKVAFIENKILYNGHTVVKNKENSFDDLKKEFLKYID